MRIYYDMIVWEEIDDTDTEKLMSKFGEFAKRLAGYGMVSWKMRAGQEQQTATPEEIEQYNAEQEALAESEQLEQTPQPEPQPQPQPQPQPEQVPTNQETPQEIVEE